MHKSAKTEITEGWDWKKNMKEEKQQKSDGESLNLDLITSNDMNNDEDIGHSDKPIRFFKCDEDIIGDCISKHPIAD